MKRLSGDSYQFLTDALYGRRVEHPRYGRGRIVCVESARWDSRAIFTILLDTGERCRCDLNGLREIYKLIPLDEHFKQPPDTRDLRTGYGAIAMPADLLPPAYYVLTQGHPPAPHHTQEQANASAARRTTEKGAKHIVVKAVRRYERAEPAVAHQDYE